MPITIHGETNVGKVRTNNEDSFIAEAIWDEQHYLAVVIDGVGGYEGGEVAAKIANEKIREYLLSVKNGEPGTLLAEAVVYANEAIYNERLNTPKHKEMSCVLTACIIDAAKMQVYMAHVGDTRLYIYQEGVLEKLSHDHSLVGYREEVGDLSEADAMSHPQRNIINRDVGSALHKTDDEDFIESAVFPLKGESICLLCSDGLNDMITSREIIQCLVEKGTIQEKCQWLIDAALDAGGRDNVTVVLVNIVAPVKEESPKAPLPEPYQAMEVKLAVQQMLPTGEVLPEKEKAETKAVSPETKAAPPEKKSRPKRRSSIGPFLAGMVLGGLVCFAGMFAIKTFIPAAVSLTPAKDTTLPAFDAADSLYAGLASAQKTGKHTFNFTGRDSVIRITRPLVIYADSFVWSQPSMLHIQPADSAGCPVGLIVYGADFRVKNILFTHFEKDTIVIRNNKVARRQPAK